MTRSRNLAGRLPRLIVSGSAIAVLALATALTPAFPILGTTGALAQQDSGHAEGGGGQGSGNGQGNGQGGSNAQGGGSDSHGSAGQGGPSDNGKGPQAGGGGGEEEESDGRGPQYNQPSGGQGGNPVWAQEGIPEVELGRLSVIRSPDKVLTQALNEIVSTFDAATEATLYSGTAATFASEISNNWDTITYIDAPLQNLAVLEEYWKTGDTSLPGVTPENLVEFSAILIGSASDKTIPVTEDTVIALATIVGVVLPSSSVEAIAEKADAVRTTILAAHG